jgi:hypothetical protein
MSSFADRNRELLIERVQGDPRLGGAKVRAATTLMRISLFALIFSGIVGALLAQIAFGEGGLQFGAGLFLGYLAYGIYLYLRMGEPRVVGVMAALTNKKVVLLGSRRAGIIAEYAIAEIENLEILRKGNLLIMGKLALTPAGGERAIFFTTNRRMATSFVEEYEEIRRGSELR